VVHVWCVWSVLRSRHSWMFRTRYVYPSFFFTATATSEIYALSLHDALPILRTIPRVVIITVSFRKLDSRIFRKNCTDRHRLLIRSEEHTSELQSRFDLVCRLLLEKKKTKKTQYMNKNAEPNKIASITQYAIR